LADDADTGWGLTGHACKRCLGRILLRGETFRCADCGDETQGKPDAICGCGIRVVGAPVATGFRCGRNLAPTPANPAEVVIHFGDPVGQPGDQGRNAA
jgi:hypothetical protein